MMLGFRGSKRIDLRCLVLIFNLSLQTEGLKRSNKRNMLP